MPLVLVVIILTAAGGVFFIVGLGLFERLVPRRVLRWYQKNISAPLFRTSAGIVPGWAVVETIGRKTGRPHAVPVGGRLMGDTFWFLAGTGRETQYVRNIEANPRVRLRVHGRWRKGVAHVCLDDDARRRLIRLNPVNGLLLWVTGFDLLTIRVDLEPHVSRVSA